MRNYNLKDLEKAIDFAKDTRLSKKEIMNYFNGKGFHISNPILLSDKQTKDGYSYTKETLLKIAEQINQRYTCAFLDTTNISLIDLKNAQSIIQNAFVTEQKGVHYLRAEAIHITPDYKSILNDFCFRPVGTAIIENNVVTEYNLLYISIKSNDCDFINL